MTPAQWFYLILALLLWMLAMNLDTTGQDQMTYDAVHHITNRGRMH